MQITKLKLSELAPNTGQIPGLPINPRQWTKGDVEKIAASLKETPELFEARPLLVIPHDGQYVILGGNLRFEGARANKMKEAPAIIFPEDTPVEKLKEVVIKDNGSFGAWDFDALANEWDDLPLGEWGVPAWNADEGMPPIDDKDGGVEIDGLREPGDEEVEAYLNEAMRDNVVESLAQMEHGLKNGWISTFLTRGLAKAKFIRAKYYGEHYPQWMSLYFCPERVKTSANTRSPWEQMEMIAKGETDAGIAGLRTMTGDHLLLLLLKGSYPFGGARMPMDFPANKARELIAEFCPEQGRGAMVLDPCHGWGGRLTGALMADVGLYVGVDPSKEAHAGVEKIASAFLPYSPDSRAEFILSPFEDADLGERTFDFAITSPPYFDVEQYHGEGQSHIRYPKYDKWRDGFYRPLIEKTYEALKPGAVFCLQVGSQSYPLLDDGKALAIAAGFVVEDVRPLGGGTSSALHDNDDEDDNNEKIIILRK